MNEILELLQKINGICISSMCKDCPYYDDPYDCKVAILFSELADSPSSWDMEKIKEILDGRDS